MCVWITLTAPLPDSPRLGIILGGEKGILGVQFSRGQHFWGIIFLFCQNVWGEIFGESKNLGCKKYLIVKTFEGSIFFVCHNVWGI